MSTIRVREVRAVAGDEEVLDVGWEVEEPCYVDDSLTAAVAEDQDSVTITLRIEVSGAPECTADAAGGLERVTLSEALAGRALVDGSNGEALRLVR